MPRLYRVALFSVLAVAMLACGLFTRPFSNAKDTVETAQAFASAIPVQTIEALPSAFPSLEAAVSAMPGIGDIMNPTGEPVAVWKDIPIMPQATAGGESSMGTYSFKAPGTLDDVKNYYASQLESLGWSQMMTMPGGEQVAIMAYQKDNQVLTITATQQGDEVIVILATQ